MMAQLVSIVGGHVRAHRRSVLMRRVLTLMSADYGSHCAACLSAARGSIWTKY
jgi:hypothetical protein